MAPRVPFFLPQVRAYQIWGADERAGKTMASIILTWGASLIRGRRQQKQVVGYVKPLTVDEEDYDRASVRYALTKSLRGRDTPKWLHVKSPLVHVPRSEFADEDGAGPVQTQNSSVIKMARQRRLEAISATKSHLVEPLKHYINTLAYGVVPPGGWLFAETLGSPLTAIPWGLSQLDAYTSAELYLPGILVGQADKQGASKLTIAHDHLRGRSIDVQAVIVFSGAEDAHTQHVVSYFQEQHVPCFVLREIPRGSSDPSKDKKILVGFLRDMGKSNIVKNLLQVLNLRHQKTVLEKLADSTDESEIAFRKSAHQDLLNSRPARISEYSWALPTYHQDSSPGVTPQQEQQDDHDPTE